MGNDKQEAQNQTRSKTRVSSTKRQSVAEALRVLETQAHGNENALATLCDYMEQATGLEDDVTYRLAPGNEGSSWYLTATWRTGQWEGHYVMAVVYRGQLASGLIILACKVLAVRDGRVRPTRDKWYRKT